VEDRCDVAHVQQFSIFFKLILKNQKENDGDLTPKENKPLKSSTKW